MHMYVCIHINICVYVCIINNSVNDKAKSLMTITGKDHLTVLQNVKIIKENIHFYFIEIKNMCLSPINVFKSKRHNKLKKCSLYYR